MKGNLQLMEENKLNHFLNMLGKRDISFQFKIVEKVVVNDNQDICDCRNNTYHYEYVTPFESADKYYLLVEIYISITNDYNYQTEEILFGRFPLPWFLKGGQCYRHNYFDDGEYGGYISQSPEDWESEPIEVEELPLPPTAI